MYVYYTKIILFFRKLLYLNQYIVVPTNSLIDYLHIMYAIKVYSSENSASSYSYTYLRGSKVKMLKFWETPYIVLNKLKFLRNS